MITTNTDKSMSNTYKKLFIAASLFWVFDCVYIIPNIVLSHQLKDSALKINISGRQRALSQKMAKDILLIKSYPNQLQYKEQLRQDFELFDMTYSALKDGGETKDSRNNLVTIEKSKNYEVVNTLNNVSDTWSQYKTLIINVLVNSSEKNTIILTDYSNYANDVLLRQMNKITALEEESAEFKANLIQIIQLGSVIASFINSAFLSKNVLELLLKGDNKRVGSFYKS